jgi:formate dehydrogenase major subunit
MVKSVCPYCAVACGQNVFVTGQPGSAVPKGSASPQLTTGDARQYRVKYRRPFGKIGLILTLKSR